MQVNLQELQSPNKNAQLTLRKRLLGARISLQPVLQPVKRKSRADLKIRQAYIWD